MHNTVYQCRPRILDGRERRRLARETGLRHSSEAISSMSATPLESEGSGASPLALAGLSIAAAELDRLSSQARERERAVAEDKWRGREHGERSYHQGPTR